MRSQTTRCLSPVDVSPSGISYMGGNIFLRNAFGITCCQQHLADEGGNVVEPGEAGAENLPLFTCMPTRGKSFNLSGLCSFCIYKMKLG